MSVSPAKISCTPVPFSHPPTQVPSHPTRPDCPNAASVEAAIKHITTATMSFFTDPSVPCDCWSSAWRTKDKKLSTTAISTNRTSLSRSGVLLATAEQRWQSSTTDHPEKHRKNKEDR